MPESSLLSRPVTAAQTLAALKSLAESGHLRRLDHALAALVWQLDAEASPALLIAVAMLSQLEGRGHTCLPLEVLCQSPQVLLGASTEEWAAMSAGWAACPSTESGWAELLAQSAVVRCLNHPDGGEDQARPFVLWCPAGGESTAGASRLYLRRYWLHERAVVHAIRARSDAAEPVDEPLARHWLNRLFPAAADETSVNWQKLACALALKGRLTVITGGPGTGKTYTAARLLALLLATSREPAHLRIGLAAPTGKAAARLKQSIDQALAQLAPPLAAELDLMAWVDRMGPARTLHALLGANPSTRGFRHNAQHPLALDILIVDEASMIHLEMMAALLAALPAHASLILLGDKDQLASVEAGAVMGDLCKEAEAGGYGTEVVAYVERVAGLSLPLAFQAAVGVCVAPMAQRTVMLRESRRFGGPIGQLALAVNQGRVAEAMSHFVHPSDGALWIEAGVPPDRLAHWALHGRPGAEGGYRSYAQRLQDMPTAPDDHETWVRQVLADFERFRILCAVREGDWGAVGVNRAVQAALVKAGLLRDGPEWFFGRPVMVTRNDRDLGVFNGDIGLTLPSPSARAADGGGGVSALRVWFLDGDRLRSVACSRLPQVETAFAMTVHKSQGSEFEHTVLVLPDAEGALSRELVYTGITRAKTRFSLLSARHGLLERAMGLPTRRASGLGDQLSS